jgi:CheY-like chemotaxis protein
MVTVVDDREIGLALGAIDYLVKPVRPDVLLSCLARFTPTPPDEDRPLRVLAVDDDAVSRRLVTAALEEGGFEVIEATGGRDGIERARAAPVDLIVCDLMMPDVDGFAVVAALQADARTAAIPVLICTAHDLTDVEKARLRGRILGVVSKGTDARTGLREWLARFAAHAQDDGLDGSVPFDPRG